MKKEKQQLYRAIDANLNRAREGLRVVEEVFRFLKNHKEGSAECKELRHKLVRVSKKLSIPLPEVKDFRNVREDVGRKSFSAGEKKKENLKDLVMANIQRVQEALRVLEEFSKLLDEKASYQFKKCRFEAYQLEKKLLQCL